VKVSSFRKIGREVGVVCGIKEGFGFVRSHLRDIDMYFRVNEVIGPLGVALGEAAIVMGLAVSFDVVDENR
jgi:hypothetical protein